MARYYSKPSSSRRFWRAFLQERRRHSFGGQLSTQQESSLRFHAQAQASQRHLREAEDVEGIGENVLGDVTGLLEHAEDDTAEIAAALLADPWVGGIGLGVVGLPLAFGTFPPLAATWLTGTGVMITPVRVLITDIGTSIGNAVGAAGQVLGQDVSQGLATLGAALNPANLVSTLVNGEVQLGTSMANAVAAGIGGGVNAVMQDTFGRIPGFPQGVPALPADLPIGSVKKYLTNTPGFAPLASFLQSLSSPVGSVLVGATPTGYIAEGVLQLMGFGQ